MFSVEKLSRYAEVIVRQGMGVQKDQVVNVSGEIKHLELMRAICEKSYEAGALHVTYELIDPVCERTHVMRASDEGLTFVPRHFAERGNQITELGGCNLRVVAMEEPSFWSGVDPARMSTVLRSKREARKTLYEQGINQGKIQWCVAAGATPEWACHLYPQISPEAALEQLWEELYRLIRADQPDFLGAWKEHAAALHKRCEWLDELKIRELRFRGSGTDLTVRLSPRSAFMGGTKESASGFEFTANLPTEEVFTTPDWRGTHGTARITRPVLVQGKLVKGLTCEFREGILCNFIADEGGEAFQAFLETDEGARRLGEIALVGIDSPVFKSGIIFNEILLDENAACHFALGSAYKTCLRGGATLSATELEESGWNDSKVHTDFMISDESTDVDATLEEGRTVPIIRSGAFVSR